MRKNGKERLLEQRAVEGRSREREPVKRALNAAYRSSKYERAKRLLENLARQLASEHPGAASALREGLEETLTVKRLGVTGALEIALSTTNLIENLIGRVRTVSARVKRWQGGQMILRWSAVGVLEAERHFRRLKGHDDMRVLLNALRKHDTTITRTATSERAVAAA